MAKQGKQDVKEVRLDKAFIVVDGQTAIPIKTHLIELSIYQDIYEPFLSCDIIIQDATGYANIAPRGNKRQPGFTGHDILVVSYSTTFPDDNIQNKTHAFVLYNLSDRARGEESFENIMLHGISMEGWLCVDKKISRSYGHNETTKRKKLDTAHNYVKSITEEFLYNKDAKAFYDKISSDLKVAIKKELTFDDTKSRFSYIMSRVDPTEAIDRLIRESDNNNDTSLFTFYEDSKGFHFADMEKLVEKKEVTHFTYEPSNYNEGGGKKSMTDLKKIESYNVIKQTDTIETKLSGLFKSKIINIDVLRKNKNEIIYDYRKFGKKLKKLNDGGLPHEHLVSGTSDEDAAIYLRTSREGHDIQEFFTGPGKENPLPMKSNMTVSKRGSYSEHLGNIILSVIVNGDSELNVGEKIVLTIPQATTPGSSSRDAPLEIDKYLSGYYLISKIRNIIKDNKMDTVLEVVKDTESTSPIESPWKG